ncbi:hypothetical protein HPP92_029171 [Vanilla planifolia]|uniref:Uncharacterized protein n=1 Tax=Vanilla planifolia TaxID=51239 RepID=A0A835P849_VANPL|nr:hypothetical protein HPP92_029171 [Vanilla planifolia]
MELGEAGTGIGCLDGETAKIFATGFWFSFLSRIWEERVCSTSRSDGMVFQLILSESVVSSPSPEPVVARWAEELRDYAAETDTGTVERHRIEESHTGRRIFENATKTGRGKVLASAAGIGPLGGVGPAKFQTLNVKKCPFKSFLTWNRPLEA